MKGHPIKNTIGAIISLAVFIAASTAINLLALELALFFVLFSIVTYSWMSYCKKQYEPIILGIWTFLCTMASMYVIGDATIGFVIATSWQLLVHFGIQLTTVEVEMR
ncbi:hypothetical protein BRC2024_KWYBBTRE_CDS_0070 [Acinetobacter phage vB_AbaM_AB-Navy-v2]